MPKGRYNGQKPIALVRTNTPPSTKRTIPSVPEITLVKYNTAITAAINILMILSANPTFFFIVN